jgi:uncharacterized protein (TIGR00369 family)
MAFDMTMALYRPALRYALQHNGHGAALGITLDRLERGETYLTLPYSEAIVGNPITGVVHGGTIVSLLDTACGCAAMTILKRPSVTPTMDLRLDYMRPAQPHKPIHVEARVYRQSSNVIFCRGLAWQDDKESPIAHCVANFMKVDSTSIQFRSIAAKKLRRLLPWSQRPLNREDANR